MADGNLKINISADTSQVAAGFKSAATSANNFGSALQDARDKVETFRAKLELLNATALKGDVGKNLASSLKGATAELKSLEKQAGITGATTGGAFNAAYGGLRKIAQILPGIGVAGILGALTSGLLDLVNKTKEVDQATKDYQDSLDKVTGKTAEEASRVEVLVSALQSGKLSREQTKGAIEELQKISPDYFASLSKEKANVDQITAAYNNYNAALVKSIENQLKTADLTKAIQERLNAQVKFPSADAFIKEQQATGKSLQEINAELLKKSTDELISQTRRAGDIGGQAIRVTNKAIQESIDKSKESSKAQVDGVADVVLALLKEQDILKTINTAKSDIKPAKITDTTDSDLNKQITAINKQIAALEELRKQGIATRADISQLFQLKIDKVDLELPKTGFTQQQADVLKNRLQDEATKAIAASPLEIKIDAPRIVVGDQSAFNKGLADTFKDLDPSKFIKIDTSKAVQTAIDAGKGTALVIRDGLNKGINQVDIGAAFAKTLQGNLTDAIGGIAEGIGNAFSGGGFASVLESVGNSVGQFIQDFGKLLIKSAIEIQILQKAVKALALTPLAALAVGVAAIAIGAIIKNASKSSQRKLADGAIVTGPTNALIGEAGPEVVFPLNQLNKFISGVGGGGGLDVQFSHLNTFISSKGIHDTYQAEVKRRGRGFTGA